MAREVTFERESMELLRPQQVALLESTGFNRPARGSQLRNFQNQCAVFDSWSRRLSEVIFESHIDCLARRCRWEALCIHGRASAAAQHVSCFDPVL